MFVPFSAFHVQLAATRFRELSAQDAPAAKHELWQEGAALEQRLAKELVDAGLARRAAAAATAKQATGACWLQRRMLAADGSLDQLQHLVDTVYQRRTTQTTPPHDQHAAAVLHALLHAPKVLQVTVAAERNHVTVIPTRERQPVSDAQAVMSRALWTMGSVHVLLQQGVGLAPTSALVMGGALCPIPDTIASYLGLDSEFVPELWALVPPSTTEG